MRVPCRGGHAHIVKSLHHGRCDFVPGRLLSIDDGRTRLLGVKVVIIAAVEGFQVVLVMPDLLNSVPVGMSS